MEKDIPNKKRIVANRLKSNSNNKPQKDKEIKMDINSNLLYLNVFSIKNSPITAIAKKK